MLGPVGVEIVEVPQEGCIGFRIDVKDFLHLDLEGAGAKSIEFIREVLIQLQHILAVDDDHGGCTFLAILLPQVVVEAVGVHILNFFHAFVLAFFLILEE